MSQVVFSEISDPGIAASNKGRFFMQSDGHAYWRDDAGNKYRLSGLNASGVLPVAGGGTGLLSYTTGDTLYASGATTLAKLAIGSSGSVLVSNGSAPTWSTVGTGGIANDAIDDTKAGNRVPQFYRRQGGSGTDWSSAGTTTHTPTTVRMQAGVRSITITAISEIDTTVTFPTAFSNPPILSGLVRLEDPGTNQEGAVLSVHSVTASNFVLRIATPKGDAFVDTNPIPVMWTAVGPE